MVYSRLEYFQIIATADVGKMAFSFTFLMEKKGFGYGEGQAAKPQVGSKDFKNRA